MSDARADFETGRAAWDRNDLPAAETALRRALAASPADPAIKAALGSVLLKSGRLTEGFPLFDAWRQVAGREEKGAPKLPFIPWRGEPVGGRRLLIWSEHGFGDQIMYARFARLLARKGGEVSWLCPPELVRIVAALGVKALPSDQPVDLACDYYVPSSALPLGFNLTWDTTPAAPYIAAVAPRQTDARIGVMTAGNPDNVPGRNRALSDAQAARLLDLPGAMSLAPASTGAKDFQDTADLIAGLDLVISVDTAVAHLAGAMGKRVWVLVPYVADWRWPERELNPWYPTARVLRQGADLDWDPVVAGVEADVKAGVA
ncbi:MAG: tetratricopeptide repeat protein [Pseudomonadota bacterium]